MAICLTCEGTGLKDDNNLCPVCHGLGIEPTEEQTIETAPKEEVFSPEEVVAENSDQSNDEVSESIVSEEVINEAPEVAPEAPEAIKE